MIVLLAAVLGPACKDQPRTINDDSPKGEALPKPTAAVEAALPKGQHWQSEVYRLRIRSGPQKGASIVGHLAKGEVVAELERSPKAVTISGRKGHWIKVQTQTKVVGWTFSGFLQKL